MKIYSYFVCKVWNEDKKSFEVKKVKLSNDAIEHLGCYSQVDEKKFYTNWSDCWKNSNFLSKDGYRFVASMKGSREGYTLIIIEK